MTDDELLTALLAERVPAKHIADRLGLNEEQVRLQLAVLRAFRLQRRRHAIRVVQVAAVVVALTLAALWARPVLAQVACSQTLPAPLTTFCAGNPAAAADVNSNFQQLVTWLEQKVGPVGSSAVTMTGALEAPSASFATARITSVDAGTVNVGALRVSGNSSLTGNLTVTGVGGNTPHDCVARSQTGSYNTGCVAGEVAVGGGGRCSSLWRLTESLPWMGPHDADGPPAPGQAPRGWRAVCQVWGDAASYAAPQLGTFAICCKQ